MKSFQNKIVKNRRQGNQTNHNLSFQKKLNPLLIYASQPQLIEQAANSKGINRWKLFKSVSEFLADHASPQWRWRRSLVLCSSPLPHLVQCWLITIIRAHQLLHLHRLHLHLDQAVEPQLACLLLVLWLVLLLCHLWPTTCTRFIYLWKRENGKLKKEGASRRRIFYKINENTLLICWPFLFRFPFNFSFLEFLYISFMHVLYMNDLILWKSILIGYKILDYAWLLLIYLLYKLCMLFKCC